MSAKSGKGDFGLIFWSLGTVFRPPVKFPPPVKRISRGWSIAGPAINRGMVSARAGSKRVTIRDGGVWLEGEGRQGRVIAGVWAWP